MEAVWCLGYGRKSYPPSILVPGFHLCVCQIKLRGQFHSILNAKVFLSLKTLLQAVQLMIDEGRSRLSGLFLL